MNGRAYALCDGNSFYFSCERVFDAKLRAVPVVVLSNSDGCAIARTSGTKALGIGRCRSSRYAIGASATACACSRIS